VRRRWRWRTVSAVPREAGCAQAPLSLVPVQIASETAGNVRIAEMHTLAPERSVIRTCLELETPPP
jgi:hypothetical protein